jgi:small subunit ribosomal protein S15Ae
MPCGELSQCYDCTLCHVSFKVLLWRFICNLIDIWHLNIPQLWRCLYLFVINVLSPYHPLRRLLLLLAIEIWTAFGFIYLNIISLKIWQFSLSLQFGYIVLTTSAGIMDHDEARRKNVGGKVLGFFYWFLLIWEGNLPGIWIGKWSCAIVLGRCWVEYLGRMEVSSSHALSGVQSIQILIIAVLKFLHSPFEVKVLYLFHVFVSISGISWIFCQCWGKFWIL